MEVAIPDTALAALELGERTRLAGLERRNGLSSCRTIAGQPLGAASRRRYFALHPRREDSRRLRLETDLLSSLSKVPIVPWRTDLPQMLMNAMP
jgi:hypothetical protein